MYARKFETLFVVTGLDTRNRLADHGNRWEHSDVVWRLGNATLDGGLFCLVMDGFEAMLHAAEAKCICTDGPDARPGEVIGRVSAMSQPYVNGTSYLDASCRSAGLGGAMCSAVPRRRIRGSETLNNGM